MDTGQKINGYWTEDKWILDRRKMDTGQKINGYWIEDRWILDRR